jgi:hypothetical protein
LNPFVGTTPMNPKNHTHYEHQNQTRAEWRIGRKCAADPATYRVNPDVEAKIDAYIKDNPKHWAYIQGMPRDRLERTAVLNEVRQIERQERMREGMMQRIYANPKLKEAYEILVKDVPEEQREEVMAQMARQKQRTIARSQTQAQQRSQTKGEAVSV